MPTYGNPSRASILLFFFIKNFFGGTVRGELSVSCAYPTFLCGGGRVAARPDPDKPFKINRVPANANNCSGLVSRIEKPSAKAGRFGLADVAPLMSCQRNGWRD